MSKKEFQPGNSFFETAIQPNGTTQFTLSGGRERPFFFYLGINSTVPFVRLESPVAQKEVTWGDVVEVPPGSNVSVRNISYMPGDVQLQGGDIPVPPPRRVTIPVACTLAIEAVNGTLQITPDFACDTRRATRAYFCVELPELTDIVFADITGSNRQHSRNSRTATAEAYLDLLSFPSGQLPPMIPLGISLEGNAMRLTDCASVLVRFGSGLVSIPTEFENAQYLDGFYVLEY